jgi:hypothetical protein
LTLNEVSDPGGEETKRRRAAAAAALDPEVAKPSPLRKVSLNRLEAAIGARLDAGLPVPAEMQLLAGLTRLQYVFFVPETNDIVIAGPAEGWWLDLANRPVGLDSGQPILELRDLLVALRAFPADGAATERIAVSLETTAEGEKRFQQYVAGLGERVQGDADELAPQIAAGMRVRLGPAEIKFHGISPRTHLAQVLVEADYRMKQIRLGLEIPPINISSMAERALPQELARSAGWQFIFVLHDQCVRVSGDGLAVEMAAAGPKLITERERRLARGERLPADAADKAASGFARAVTANYDQLAQKLVVFGQLRNALDMILAAALMKQHHYYGRSGWQAEIFRSEAKLPVQRLAVPQHVELIINTIPKGRAVLFTTGAIEIIPRQALARDRLLADEGGKLDALRMALQAGRIPQTRWCWD